MNIYKEEYLKKYIRLAVRMGAAVQPGQRLVITSPVECAHVARIAMNEAYEAGAREVIVCWNDEAVDRGRLLHASDNVLDEYPSWNKLLYDQLSAEGAAFMRIVASNPEAYKEADFERLMRVTKAADLGMRNYRKLLMNSDIQWCVISAAAPAWALKVFPDAPDAETATMWLWDAIFSAARVDDSDPVENWQRQNSRLKEITNTLNGYRLSSLKISNTLGTDLTIELPEGHIWKGGGDVSHGGIAFMPNIPTEEIFTAPRYDGVNGKVVSTKPLVYGGNLIDGFSLTFKNGRVVEFNADKNRELLDRLLQSAKNQDYLGEVALVPHSSPISKMGLLFYNTLYDENASCHLALGQAYPDCLEGGGSMTPEELTRSGMNQCDNHHDFMIGSEDLQITGKTGDGTEIDIFKDGDYVL